MVHLSWSILCNFMGVVRGGIPDLYNNIAEIVSEVEFKKQPAAILGHCAKKFQACNI